MRFQVWWLQCAVYERSTVKAEARKGIPKKTTSGARPGVIGVSLLVAEPNSAVVASVEPRPRAEQSKRTQRSLLVIEFVS